MYIHTYVCMYVCMYMHANSDALYIGYWLGVDPSAASMKKFNPVIQYAANHFGYPTQFTCFTSTKVRALLIQKYLLS